MMNWDSMFMTVYPKNQPATAVPFLFKQPCTLFQVGVQWMSKILHTAAVHSSGRHTLSSCVSARKVLLCPLVPLQVGPDLDLVQCSWASLSPRALLSHQQCACKQTDHGLLFRDGQMLRQHQATTTFWLTLSVAPSNWSLKKLLLPNLHSQFHHLWFLCQD